MKRKFEHPEPTPRESAAPSYWRSPGELAQSPEFQQWLDKEFPEGASEANEQDRRSFLKLMGASAGLAGVGLAGCRMPEMEILPYSKQPEKMVPGVPMYYASSFPGSQENIPLIVETNDARPTKIEGNPSDPSYGGATDSFAQASVLDLYDPDRLAKSFVKGGKPVEKAKIRTILTDLSQEYAGGGKGLVFLAQPSTSPTRQRLVASLKEQFPQATWAEYEPVDGSGPVRAMAKIYGKPIRPLYEFDKAKRVLAIDSDFLATEPGHIRYSRAFGKARHVKDAAHAKDMNRLYAVESNFSLTGGMADHRLRAATAHMPAFLALLAAAVMEQSSGFSGGIVAKLKKEGHGLHLDQKWIDECAKDLLAHPGQAVVVVGSHLPEEAHLIAYVINNLLDAPGNTVTYIQQPALAHQGIADVAKLLRAGSVETLVVIGGNPAYDAPADLNFADAMTRAKRTLRHGYYDDETSQLADVTIAATHYLESWGDGRAICGDYLPVQPMILPLFDGYSEIEVLAMVQGIDPAGQGYELVKETFAEITGQSGNVPFEKWLAEGVWLDARWPAETVSVDTRTAIGDAIVATPAVSADALEVRIIPSTHAWDGRYNNNGWLMECPDPMTKLTWDNAILVSPKLGKKLGITPDPILMDKLGQLHMNANQFKAGKEQAHRGEITLPNGKKVTGQFEGYVEVTPYWNTKSKVKVCAFDAQAFEKGPHITNGTEVDCSVSAASTRCGCGPNLRWCMNNAHQATLRASLLEQALLFAADIVANDRPYTDIVLAKDMKINGPIAHYLKYQTQAAGGLLYAKPDQNYAVPSDLKYEDAGWRKVTRTQLHAGVLTMPLYLLKFASNRGRANRFYNAFLCSHFQAPAGGLPPASDKCHGEPNLMKRCGCKYCHQTVEPVASYWGRWAEAGLAPRNPGEGRDQYPPKKAECSTYAKARRDATCRRFYFIQPNHPDEEQYRGMLLAYVFATPAMKKNIEAGPMALAKKHVDNGDFAACTARKMWTWLLGKAPYPQEEERIMTLAHAFQRDNYNLRSLIKAIVSSPEYRQGRSRD